MTLWFVSRHSGARAWARARSLQVDHWAEHLDVEDVREGDVVVGTLPVDKIAGINARGARFLALCLDLTPEMRGRELTPDDMETLGGRLVEYRAERVEST